MTEKTNGQEQQLYDELFELEFDVMYDLDSLIHAEWDSPTLQIRLKKQVKAYFEIQSALDDFQKKNEVKK